MLTGNTLNPYLDLKVVCILWLAYLLLIGALAKLWGQPWGLTDPLQPVHPLAVPCLLS